MAKDNKHREVKMSVFDGVRTSIPTFDVRSYYGGNDTYERYKPDNKFPYIIYELTMMKCSITSSIIDGTVNFIMGNTIKYNENPSLQRLVDEANSEGDSMDDIIKKIAYDLCIFGGFALEIVPNKLGEINELYALDFRNVRVDKELKTVYYSEDWIRKSNEYKKYPIFKGEIGKQRSVFYFKGHKTRDVYPIPDYITAIPAIMTATEIPVYHLNAIKNNFNGNFIINYNHGIPTEDEQALIEQQIADKFSGADNAGKFLLAFNDNKDKAITVERIQDDKCDEKYKDLRAATKDDIYAAFNAMPQLFGRLSEGNVFNKEEYADAYALYHKEVVQNKQRDIVRTFNKIFGISDSITFETFSLNNEQVQNITEE